MNYEEAKKKINKVFWLDLLCVPILTIVGLIALIGTELVKYPSVVGVSYLCFVIWYFWYSNKIGAPILRYLDTFIDEYEKDNNVDTATTIDYRSKLLYKYVYADLRDSKTEEELKVKIYELCKTTKYRFSRDKNKYYKN